MRHYTKEDIIRLVREEDAQFIRMQFTDIFGQLKNVAITASQIGRALDNQIMMDGSSIAGFVRIEESDQYLWPDLDTFAILPWRPQYGKVARLICDVHNPDGTAFAGDPRGVLKRVLRRFEKIKDINKVYGFPIYIGSLFAVGTGSFVGIALGLLSEDNITVGFYNIAQQISIPLSMIPNIISTVLYKRYVSTSRINSKILLILLSLCIAIFICILLFAKPFISLVFGEEYLTAIPLLKYMCFGALSYGIADFFNKYLLSKGFGVQLRNVSIIVGIIMLLIAYPLIYYWGCYGAAYIKAVTGIVYIISIVFTYKKSIKFSNAD